MGFSELFAVSSSTMLASVATSSFVSPMAFALVVLSSFQKLLFAFSIFFISLSSEMFQYTSYVSGMNKAITVDVSQPYLLQNS